MLADRSLIDEQGLARTRRRRLPSLAPGTGVLLLTVAVVLAMALGFWGFQREPAIAGHTVFDSIYESLRLIGFHADIEGSIPWQLQVARFLVPALLAYGVFRGLIAVFHEQAAVLRVHLLARRHVVVAGLGESGLRIAFALAGAGLRVVVVEADREHPALDGCRRRRIPVVVGDASDPATMLGAACDRAQHLFACCGADATNLDVLAAAAAVARHGAAPPLTVHVLISARSLWRMLAGAPLEAGAGLRTDFISVGDLAGRAVVEADPGAWMVERGSRAHLVALAAGELGRSATIHAARKLLGAGAELTVTLVGDAAASDLEALAREAPWLARNATVRALALDPTVTGALTGADLAGLTAGLICDPDPAAGLAVAHSLALATPGSAAPLLVAVEEESVARALSVAGLGSDWVEPVAARRRVLGPGLLLGTTLETLARAKHEDYVEQALARGESPGENASLRPWDELPEALKESNRRFADGVASKLAGLGVRLVPDDPGSGDGAQLAIDADTLEQLARDEHERWVADLLADGWRATAGPKDPEGRLHPLLVGWEELPEVEREKDRDPIRSLPTMLRKSGFALVGAEGVP